MTFDESWHAHRADALDRILDAALRPEAWNDVIAHVCKVIGASSGAIAIRSRKPGIELIDPVAATWPQGAVEEYLTYPREEDPVIVELTRRMFAARNGASFIIQELLDDREYRKSPFFNDFADKFDIPYLAGAAFDIAPEHFATLMIYREDGSPVFGRQERRFLDSLVGPLQSGLAIRRQFKGAMVAHSVLGRLAIPVATLDERGRVAYANRAAEQLFERGDVVSVSGGRVCTCMPDTTAILQEICLDAVRGEISRRGRELFLKRPDGAPALRLVILPLSHELADSLWGGDVPAAIFFFEAQGEVSSPDVNAVLRETYGCTETEARVAALYAEGATRLQIAKQCGVSGETVKTHLKKSFRKTQARNKAELAQLLQKLRVPLH